jgi:hypothetical protein
MSDPRPGDPGRETPRRRNHLLWLGPLVAFAGGVSYFLVFARYPVLRDFPWLNLPWVLAGLALSGVALRRAWTRQATYRGKALGPVGLGFSALLAFLFVFYVFGVSSWLPEPTPTATGLVEAPGFRLLDHRGQPVSLEDYRGRKVVLTFYRGFW